MQPFERATGYDVARLAQTRAELLRQIPPGAPVAEAAAEVDRLIAETVAAPTYLNDSYQVQVRDLPPIPGWPDLAHLSIRRLDREPIHDWRELQEIKNLIVGPENEAVELYPAESRLVDLANQYHLYVLKDAAARFPFGFFERRVSSASLTTAKQRPREPQAGEVVRATA